MNFKKTLVSLFAATAIVGSMVVPTFAAEDKEGTSQSTVNENGTFAFSFGGSIVFADALVSSPTGQTVQLPASANHKLMSVSDERTSSPGYTLQMTATDLTHTENSQFFIDSENLSVRNGGGNGGNPGGVHSSCLWSGAPAPVGGNSFQTHTWLLSSSAYTPIGLGVDLFTAGPGRGCDWIAGNGGTFQYNMQWQLAIPGGTATGSYQGKVTIGEVTAPPAD